MYKDPPNSEERSFWASMTACFPTVKSCNQIGAYFSQKESCDEDCLMALFVGLTYKLPDYVASTNPSYFWLTGIVTTFFMSAYYFFVPMCFKAFIPEELKRAYVRYFNTKFLCPSCWNFDPNDSEMPFMDTKNFDQFDPNNDSFRFRENNVIPGYNYQCVLTDPCYKHPIRQKALYHTLKIFVLFLCKIFAIKLELDLVATALFIAAPLTLIELFENFYHRRGSVTAENIGHFCNDLCYSAGIWTGFTAFVYSIVEILERYLPIEAKAGACISTALIASLLGGIQLCFFRDGLDRIHRHIRTIISKASANSKTHNPETQPLITTQPLAMTKL